MRSICWPETTPCRFRQWQTLDRTTLSCIFIHMLRDTMLQNVITAKALPTGSGPGR